MSQAADNYPRYYAEKIWQLIPAIYKEQDAGSGTLRAIVEVIAEQAAIVRRSEDRLWEDEFIDTCDDWAVSYIGDLLGTRMLSAKNARGRRVDVSKTIYYRRRKGTPRILEELIYDITGWRGKMVENFRRLGRSYHGLDADASQNAGKITATAPGGWCNLRNAYGTTLMHGAFDEFSYSIDVRKHEGMQGRYNIPKLAFHLYRLMVFPIKFPTVFRVNNNDFMFDPSGRRIQLFATTNTATSWDAWTTATEAELPGPINCRLFNFDNAAAGAHILYPQSLFVADDGLLPGSMIPREQVDAVTFPSQSAKRLMFDPAKGEFRFNGAAVNQPLVLYHIAFSGPVGAATYYRKQVDDLPVPSQLISGGGPLTANRFASQGVTLVTDSKTYGGFTNKSGIVDMTLVAAHEQRPYFRMEKSWTLDTGAQLDSQLIIDGLWIGSKGNGAYNLVLDGDYKLVVIRNCTLDPGNENGTNEAGENLRALSLIIKGKVKKLCIERSITGPIQENGGRVQQLVICDSIVHSYGGTQAIQTTFGEVILQGVTVFGDVGIHRLHSSDTIIHGRAIVIDTQTGCFRFGAASKSSRVPRPYESYLFNEDISYWFTSMAFGHAGYAQLTEAAPGQVLSGSEAGSEMGAFCFLNNPIKLDGLKFKINEYMPFGLIPIFINKI